MKYVTKHTPTRYIKVSNLKKIYTEMDENTDYLEPKIPNFVGK